MNEGAASRKILSQLNMRWKQKELTVRNITVGCKLSHGDISLHTQIASNPRIDPNYFALFTGLGQQLLPVLTIGGAGAIDGLAAFFPRVVVRLWEATLQGGLDEARSIQVSIGRIYKASVMSIDNHTGGGL